MRSQGLSWNEISLHFGRKIVTCHAHFTKLHEKATKGAWSAETDLALKGCYEKRKAEFWKNIANDMGSNYNWKVLEDRAFELGKKGLKT